MWKLNILSNLPLQLCHIKDFNLYKYYTDYLFYKLKKMVGIFAVLEITRQCALGKGTGYFILWFFFLLIMYITSV